MPQAAWTLPYRNRRTQERSRIERRLSWRRQISRSAYPTDLVGNCGAPSYRLFFLLAEFAMIDSSIIFI